MEFWKFANNCTLLSSNVTHMILQFQHQGKMLTVEY